MPSCLSVKANFLLVKDIHFVEIINQDIAEQLFNTEHLFLKRIHTTDVFSCLIFNCPV